MKRVHLFPFRTQQLSSSMQTIVGRRRPVKICSRRIFMETLCNKAQGFLLFLYIVDLDRIFSYMCPKQKQIRAKYIDKMVKI